VLTYCFILAYILEFDKNIGATSILNCAIIGINVRRNTFRLKCSALLGMAGNGRMKVGWSDLIYLFNSKSAVFELKTN